MSKLTFTACYNNTYLDPVVINEGKEEEIRLVYQEGIFTQESNLFGHFKGIFTAYVRAEMADITSYSHWNFLDGSTMVVRVSADGDNYANVFTATFEIVHGTGKYEGVKGTGVVTEGQQDDATKMGIYKITLDYQLPA